MASPMETEAVDRSTLLAISQLNRGFVDPQGRRAQVLSDFSMTLARGETVALWGPSGSGKTTLLNLVAGLLPSDSGRIAFYPATGAATTGAAAIDASPLNIHSLSEDALLRYRREQVGYVFQFFNLIETLTVAENVRLALELAGRLELWADYAPRLAALGIAALAERFPAELSGGEQQRVAVLRALAHGPALVLADEPTGNLDKTNSERVADLLWQEVRQQNAAMLIATHSEAIARRADRVIELGGEQSGSDSAAQQPQVR